MNEEKYKFKLSDISINPRTKAIFMLIFYGLMMVLLFIFLQMSASNSRKCAETPKKVVDVVDESIITSKVEGFVPIKSNNFNYVYTLIINNEVYTYTGSKYNLKDKFNINTTKEYYMYDDLNLIKNEEGIYTLTDKPYKYLDFFNTKLIEKLILNANYSQTLNSYYLTSNKIDTLNNNSSITPSDSTNTITINRDTTGNIIKVELNLLNYVKSITEDEELEMVKLTLEYKDFGKILDLSINK